MSLNDYYWNDQWLKDRLEFDSYDEFEVSPVNFQLTDFSIDRITDKFTIGQNRS